MAVSSTTTLVQYQGNGSDVTPYPTTFQFLDEDWIRVEVADLDGTVTALDLGTDFTVTGAGDPAGGEIITAEAYDEDFTVTIFREVPITQLLDLDYNDRLPSTLLERSLDKLTYICQQIAGNLSASAGRAITFPASEPAGNVSVLPAPVVRRDTVLGFNAVTGALELFPRATFAADAMEGVAFLVADQAFTGRNIYQRQVAHVPVLLTDNFTINWNAYRGNLATVTLAGNRFLANPTNIMPGTYILRVVQDATGGRTLSFGSRFKTPSGEAIVLQALAGNADILTFVNFGTSDLYLVSQYDFDVSIDPDPEEEWPPGTLTYGGVGLTFGGAYLTYTTP